MPDFIKLFIRKFPFSISMILFFLLFSVDGWAFFYRGPQPNRWHHWAERSKQKAWSTNWSRRQWGNRNWTNGDWMRWRRNNYYSGYGYGYQRPYYTTYWDSYPSKYANYVYPSYPFNGKWYRGSWSSFGTPTQPYYNNGYYSGSP